MDLEKSTVAASSSGWQHTVLGSAVADSEPDVLSIPEPAVFP
jgi:hypothetical protein